MLTCHFRILLTTEKYTVMISSAISFTETPPCPRSFHASAVVGDGVYIHGGLDSGSNVLSDLYRFDTKLKSWRAIEANPSRPRRKSAELPALEICNAPSLSHHCAIAYKHRYIILIGGWSGRKRTSDVFLFDSAEAMWNRVTVFGEIPVGLSSHTANFVTEREILIIGREGGIHTHRRSGDAFTLNIFTGEYKQAMYGVDSRSGHTSTLLRSSCSRGYSIFVYSGRKTGRQCSFVGSWNTKNEEINAVSTDFAVGIKDLISRSAEIDIPTGRQHCKALCIADEIVLIYGGQLWQARDFVSSEIFAYNHQKNSWYKLPQSSALPRLMGFSLDIGNDGCCYVFGGSDGKKNCDRLWNLSIST